MFEFCYNPFIIKKAVGTLKCIEEIFEFFVFSLDKLLRVDIEYIIS